MIKLIKKYAATIFTDWVNTEIKLFEKLLNVKKDSILLDLGCGDARLTKIFAKKIKAKEIIGVDGLPKKEVKFFSGFKYKTFNLNRKFPLKSRKFDIVISHFSIEHLYNTGDFLSECYRVLKSDGLFVVSTDNLASWPNIASLILGWQPFSTTNGFGKGSLGNPLALRANFIPDKGVSGEYGHNKVLSYQLLRDALERYGFKIEKMEGVGYFPFKGLVCKLFNTIDDRHSHFLIVKAKKTK